MGQLVGIVLAGLTLRLALILAAGSRPQIFEYDGLARNLLSGQGYVYRHRPLDTLYRSYYSGVFYEWLAAAMYAMFPPGRDTGPGIALADAERIFEPFVRLDAARTGETGGTGLGLAIAHSIVRAHGGTLSLESRPGAGSQFTIRPPLA